MYLTELQGHGTSASPVASGLPTLCTAGTQLVVASMSSRADVPMRVITDMLETT